MRIAITLAAALGVLAAAPLSSSFASNIDGTTIDLSAQQNQQNLQKKKGPPPKAAPHKPQVNQQHRQNKAAKNSTVLGPQKLNQHGGHKPAGPKNVTTTTINKKTTNVVIKNNKPPRQVTFGSNRQTFAGTKARGWRNNGTSSFHGRNYSYWRGGPWRHRYNGGWRTYAAIGALSAIAVGTATYYPYAYLDVPQNVCEGITEDGCQLSWAEVDTVEGGVAPACVTYCPWE